MRVTKCGEFGDEEGSCDGIFIANKVSDVVAIAFFEGEEVIFLRVLEDSMNNIFKSGEGLEELDVEVLANGDSEVGGYNTFDDKGMIWEVFFL